MLSKFSQRSTEAELLDAPDIPKPLLFRNLEELDLVNKTLGGHAVTISGINHLINKRTKIYTIADIGCGGGDALIFIANWARKNKYRVQLIGVDINADAIEYMLHASKGYPEISGVVSDYQDFLKENSNIDVVHCSLFCHHLTDFELTNLLLLLKQAKHGFIINDLHRHWFAYYSIKFLTRLLNGSQMVKNDAPLSVLRGFKRKELKHVLKKAGMEQVEVKWCWAFRYLVVGKNGIEI